MNRKGVLKILTQPITFFHRHTHTHTVGAYMNTGSWQGHAKKEMPEGCEFDP